jgi:hypothetical protein
MPFGFPYGTDGMALYVTPVMSLGGVGRPFRKGTVQKAEVSRALSSVRERVVEEWKSAVEDIGKEWKVDTCGV